MDRGLAQPRPVRWSVGTWHAVALYLDCQTQTYALDLNGKRVKERVPFAHPVESVERLLFRTGPWRGDVRAFILDGEPESPGLYQEDLPGADHRRAGSRYLIDDVKTAATPENAKSLTGAGSPGRLKNAE
jgi:hypothetical protein